MTLDVAALTYTARGWRVFPLKPGTKDGHYLSDGHRGASNDFEQVAQWWQQYPDANIGLNLAASGLIAVDPDTYKPGCEWNDFIRDRDLPETLVQTSARGGKHYIFTSPPGNEFAGKLCSGVDIKRNGYIVVAPSTFEGEAYTWDNNNNPAPVPDWVPRKVAPNDCGPCPMPELHGIDICALPISDEIKNLIRSAPSKRADPAFDRSSAIMQSINALRHHVTPEQCLSILSDPANAISEKAREKRDPAAWLWDYTVGKAYEEISPERIFGGQPVALPAGASDTPPPAPAQLEPLDGYADIIAAAPHDNGKTTLIECVRTLHGHLPIRFDEFSQTIIATMPLAWDKRGSYPRQWTDLDTIHCQTAAQAMLIRPSKDTTFDAVAMIANHNRFHPVRDYLNGLAWDGIPRLDGWLNIYLKANDSEFNKLAGAKFMISAVARVMNPGCKVDTVLVLEGEQGRRKSSAINALTGSEWFTDELPDLHTKDAAIQLGGKWIIEVSELSAMGRTDVETVKKFMSRSVDRYRVPYGKVAIDHPRQSVFIATTNDDRYLKDQTGNRRFWPVACGEIDLDAVRRDRDQFWAESVTRYRAGERWWLEGDENRIAEIEQEERREVDPWEEPIGAHLAGLGGFPTSMDRIARTVLCINYDRQNSSVTKRIKNCLRHHNYGRQQVRGQDGKRSWMYAPQSPLS